jgi:hypothetical protein
MEKYVRFVDTSLEGLVNGAKVVMDPLGLLISKSSGLRTLGGTGFDNLTIKGEKSARVDYEKAHYSVAKIGGYAFGGFLQYLCLGLPQAASLVLDYLENTVWKNGRRPGS